MNTIPEKILEIARLLHTQDGRCTSHPIYYVQTRDKIYGIDPENGGDAVWMHEDGDEVDLNEWEPLEEEFQRTGNTRNGYYRTGVLVQWKNVQPFLTLAAAQAYINVNAHRLEFPRIYVDSGYRNLEWQEIRAFLKSLVKNPDSDL